MQLVNQIRFGPFSTSYHRDLVDMTFKEQFELFLREELLPQLDSPLQELDGTLTATFARLLSEGRQHCRKLGHWVSGIRATVS